MFYLVDKVLKFHEYQVNYFSGIGCGIRKINEEIDYKVKNSVYYNA